MINKTLGIPYAVFVNGLDVYAPQNKKRAAFMMKAVLRNARRIIAISGYTEKIIRRVMPDAAVTVIHPAIDVDAYVMKPANAARKEEGKIILTVARLVLHKGHETVIRGLPLVLARFPSLKYVIVGDGPCRASLEALAKETGVADHVRFTGYVLNTELAAYYNDCDVFVLASEEKDDDREGFGIVLLEAAASGRPVVASNSGGIPEAVAQGVTALLVEPRDERALADAVIRLLSDPEYARQLGDNGRRRVESEFSLGVLTTRLEELITS